MKNIKLMLLSICLLGIVLSGCGTDIKYGESSEKVYNDCDYNTNNLYGKTALFFGDSLCAGKTIEKDSGLFGYGWAGIIGDKNNMNWANYGRNGAVCTKTDDSERMLSDQIEAAAQVYSEADYVIFEGGVNDADIFGWDEKRFGSISDDYENFDIETFSGAFEFLISKIIYEYPDAKIGYIIPPKMGESPYDAENNVRRMYFERAIEICEKWGVPYLDLWNKNTLNPELEVYYDSDCSGECDLEKAYYTDGQHLTLRGYEKIVSQIEAFMRSL